MSFVTVKQSPQFFYVHLNRPDKRNAFHPTMIEELRTAFLQADQSSCRAVVLTGEGESFCAGADLDWMQSMVSYTKEQNVADSEKLFDMFYQGLSCRKPIICQAQGHVMGGALGLLAIADYVLAEKQTVFSFSEVKLGLAPAVISPFVNLKVPHHHAKRLMLFGERFDVSLAESAGLVNSSYEKPQAKDALSSIKSQVLANGPEALMATKQLLLESHLQKIAEQKQFVSTVIAERRVSLEGQAGLLGFLNKQPISWKLKAEDE